jgi:isocitrate dehydrogenase
MLDLYVCLRPVRWFTGVPSPVKHPEKVDMVIFRENTEDIYAGIEFEAGTPEAQRRCSTFPQGRRISQGPFGKIRFPDDSRSASASSPSQAVPSAPSASCARHRVRHRATSARA